jgi:hypothetical protein
VIRISVEYGTASYTSSLADGEIGRAIPHIRRDRVGIGHEVAEESVPMLTAPTRAPGPGLARCVLTHLVRQTIDPDRALAHHRAYQATLRDAGVRSDELPTDAALPDGVFVEDTAVLLDEVAVLTSPTSPSRRGELVAAALVPFRRLARLPPDRFLEGGDVLRVRRDNTPAKS